MSKNLYVIGTGTDVGKTYVTALILKKLTDCGIRNAYFKAAVSGNERGADGVLIPGDAAYVKKISGIDQPLDEMCPYVYERAYSPHLAAIVEDNPIDINAVGEKFRSVCERYDYVTAEGAGGILCPLCFGETKLNLDELIKMLNTPCLLVADAGLGTINYVGLTSHYLKSVGIVLKGIIFNNFEPGNIIHEDNIKMCEYMTGTEVAACVKRGDTELDISIDRLLRMYE